ncbi:saccharopine dehydrogenase C-terminal domain-containing protein [Pseudobacter ginsenosidimutans]|uniref:Saccharopine dehydrogenase-like NADP-dependent oxidoreductase n=1 Tax=Pseudobacter ginsenosidimutans TaxID=661488 RepID=A0A4Q7N4Q4_9BACT|nr:saccharopine dehydrogenase C-terminal domain-containing protein [Pseudobacter ginsenosidimutans]RZS75989.1 saccharopine dehydrogenase-like NADP-dependent oxidoreductase [Pseudobacter ginsenosidimutans]
MKHILVFGAGKSATCLIDYLIKETDTHRWALTVVDGNLELASSKTAGAPHVKAVAINVEQDEARRALVYSADIVISLLPPFLHYLVAKDCVQYGKHLLTASYVDEKIKALKDEIAAKGLFFLCEMGLDPGIDHMSAMQLISAIRAKGGAITSFKSHCGGLVAPESDNNPWHYKISWNPRNVVMAGKAGAVYKENNEKVEIPYTALFNVNNTVQTPGLGELAWYANRDSLSYIPIYGLEESLTFLRTTLRYPAFNAGWKQIIWLHLTDETVMYNTDGLPLSAFFREHFRVHDTTDVIAALSKEDPFYQQLDFLGLNDEATRINKGLCTAADVLQFALEQKLVLASHDKDMIVMLHEIDYLLNGQIQHIKSCLLVKGEDQLRTAMAKTVGLPLGIAAKLILLNEIKLTGLHIPILPEIYEPVLKELYQNGIIFHEEEA